MSQMGGEFQQVDEAGNPMFEDGAPVLGHVNPTGWVLRQVNSNEQVPFYSLIESIEVGTYPSSTSLNVGESIKAMNGHAIGFDIKCIDGKPLFTQLNVDGNFIELTDEQIAEFTVNVAQDGEDEKLEIKAPEGCIIHNNVLYRQVDHVIEVEEAEIPTTVYAQFYDMRPLLISFKEGQEVLVDYNEALDLIDGGTSVGVRTMSCRIKFGPPRREQKGATGLDYPNVIAGIGWPTIEVKNTNMAGDDYITENTLWAAVRPLEATILRQIRHSKALAARFPDQYGKFPEYCKPVELGGYIAVSSRAPSRIAARREEQALKQSGTGTPTRSPLDTTGVSQSIPSPEEDLLKV